MIDDMEKTMRRLIEQLNNELLADEADKPEAEENTSSAEAEFKTADAAPNYGTVRCADGSVHEIVPAA